MNNTIDFVDNASTKEAFVYSLRFTWKFWKNIGAAIDRFVHEWPWAPIAITILTSVVISVVEIGHARAERDHYLHIYDAQRDTIDRYKGALHLN